MSGNILERLASVSPEKRKLLEILLKEEGVALGQSVIVPQPRAQNLNAFPVSFAQERLWFLDQLEPDSPRYNIPLALQANGRLHIPSLEQAITEIVRRHEILRTTFTELNGELVQIIAPELTIPLIKIDMHGQPETAVHKLMRDEARRPFDLATGPLFRLSLIQYGSEEHIILLTMHHIISDGWSMGILVRELAALYAAYLNEDTVYLSPLPIQYADFAHWQREWLQGDALEAQLHYWQKELTGVPPLLQLPTDRPRPAVSTNRGGCLRFTLSQQLTKRLQALSTREGDTLFMTLLAAFQTLLYRYTGQEDICLGTPIANRTRSEIEALIGFFVNTLVIRTNFAGKPTFCQVLEQVRETTLNAYANQDLPFELVVDALHPERNLGHSPLFQVMFAWQNAPTEPLALPGLSLQPLPTEKNIATFDLTLSMGETEEGLSGTLEYNRDLFEETTMQRLVDHLETLLTAVARNPHQPVTTLPILTLAERQQLVAWNDTVVPYALDQPVHALFEDVVRHCPNETAVFYEGHTLTFAQLNRRANQLAGYLQKLGLVAEDVVGIYLEPSLEMIVAVLGTLKAGGAYLPLDATYPADRLSYMMTDANPAFLLTKDDLYTAAKEIANGPATIINLDADWPQIAQEASVNPNSQVTAGNLAYIIYTSGSTGKPKGTLLQHRGLCNLAQAYVEQLELDATCRLLRFFSFGFDGSVGDIFSALIGGAALYLPPREILLSPTALHDYIQANHITHILMTPSMLAVLPNHDLPALRMVLAGGEQLTREIAGRWLPGRRILNAYGPTEATVVSVMYIFEDIADLPETAAAVPIGRPMPNTQVYLLDKKRQPVPVCVPGELYIGGVGLARGYLNQPALTAERFMQISPPLSIFPPMVGTEGGQVYRTGDLCRYLPDGNIEFLGRIDSQVKLRGFRIELGEIESLLQQRPELETAVVILREDKPGQKRLVAYIVAQPEVSPSAQTLHGFLAGRLPTYMLPTAFVELEALPRLPNGKVDRAALPQPSGSHDELVGSYVAPRTPIEEMLVGVWAQLLPVTQIGIHDNFFDLGGHSLMATQLLSRLRELFQIELPLRDLFAAPTIAELAQSITSAQQAQATTPAHPITPAQNREELPLSFAQQRLWFLNQLEPENAAYNIPQAVRLNGRLQMDALAQSLNHIVARHEALRTGFVMVDGQPALRVVSDAVINLNLVDLRHLPLTEREAEAARLGMAEAQQPFDLGQPPLLRTSLYQLADDDFVALLTMHHIISDGWSMGVLIQELMAVYTAVVNKEPVSLPDLPIQYSDYAQWQHRWLEGAVLDSQLDYWQHQLAGLTPLLELPTDRPRPAVQTANGAHQKFSLPSATQRALNTLSQSAGTTLFMTLLAVFQTLLYRYTGQSDMAVGTPIANRNRAEVEGLIGFFVNTLVMRAELSGIVTFQELLHQVRQTALAAYSHQDLPFDRLVDSLQPERNLSHTPLFQVMFILQNAPLGAVELPDLTLRPFAIEPGIASFDLTLIMEETEDGLAAAFEYNTDLFDSGTITRMIGHFQTLLAGILAAPETPLADLPLLTEPERQQLLVDWNDTAVPLPPKATLHYLFEAQVARTPDAVAAVCGQDQLTYAQLNRRANQLAHALQKRGVTPGAFVGVALERSLEMLVGLLGILKAGAAYLPLDPNYPPDRLAFMIQDARPAVILTHRATAAEQWLSGSGRSAMPTLNLDADWPQIAQGATDNLNLAQEATLAYLIYTSGSTGQPKGVPVSHKAAVNHNLATIALFHLQPHDRVWQFATINFDTAVEEIFPTLISGATLVLRSQEIPPVSDLCRLAAQQQLTILDLPTAYWHAWVHHLAQTGEPLPDCLRLVAVGGEKVSAEVYRLWQALVDHTKIIWINGYGPTETTVISTAFQAEGHLEGEVPIGCPIANTQVYVLDANMAPVPIGVPGELYIGGVGVAEGYLNRPELTTERFIQLSVSSKQYSVSSKKLNTDHWSLITVYRTGDLVRYRPDGNLEYLGRTDNQVKVRGFRIELGEIEACLEQHAQVQETAVVVREDVPNQKRLVAYVVATGETPTVTELRHFLEANLPTYMLPAAFVFLDGLPLMPNGKIDRRALPAPDQSRPELASAWAEPGTEQEKALAAIWETVLGLDKVGIHDNFFELGGDSILSIQVVARANQTGLHLTARQFFAGPTIAEMAAAAATSQPIQAEQGIVNGTLPLTPIQRWFFDQDLPEPHHWNQAILLKVKHPLEREMLQTAVFHLLQHHDSLRLRFSQKETGWNQENAPLPNAVPLVWRDLAAVDAAKQAVAIAEEATRLQASLHLGDGPVFLAAYFDLGPTRAGRLLLIAHHLVIDGVSWRILLEDLQTLYEQVSQQKQPQLPLKTTSFRHWASRLAAHARSEDLRHEVDYWLAVTAGGHSLPRDFAGGKNSEASARTVTASLSAEDTEALLRDVPAAYRTEMNDVLLTALAQTIGSWSRSRTVLVDLESHGRMALFEDVDLSRTVGWFTAVYPVRLNLGRSSEPGAILKAMKEQLRRIPNQGIGYGLLRYLSEDDAIVQTLHSQPQAEIGFNYLGQIDQTLSEAASFAPAPESRGADRSLLGQRHYLLDVTAVINAGQLQITWTYSKNIHHRQTVDQLSQDYIKTLRAVITHCQSAEAGGVTPSDFPLANLDQKKLNKLLHKMTQKQS